MRWLPALVLIPVLTGALACETAEQEEPSPIPSALAFSPTVAPPPANALAAPASFEATALTSTPKLAEVFSMLPQADDMPAGFVVAGEPHSVIAPEGPGGPPNARVLYELAEEPADLSAISCLEFYVAQFPSETEAQAGFSSLKDFYSSPSNSAGQMVTALKDPAVGDESVASTLLSTAGQIGSCGSRPVYAYAAVAFRRGSVVADVVGFSPKETPNPALAFQMAELLLSRIDEAAPRK